VRFDIVSLAGVDLNAILCCFPIPFPPPLPKRWSASAAWCNSSRACTCCPSCRFK
jgi:hypothetical protein